MKLKKGDQVLITAGKDKGRKGKIEKILPKLDRVLVPGINVYKKHLRPQGEKQPGGIVDAVRPLPVSNLALICPKCNLPTRVGYRLAPVTKSSPKTRRKIKQRICQKCRAII